MGNLKSGDYVDFQTSVPAQKQYGTLWHSMARQWYKRYGFQTSKDQCQYNVNETKGEVEPVDTAQDCLSQFLGWQ